MFSRQGLEVVASPNFAMNQVDFHVIQRPAGDPFGVLAVGHPVVMRTLDPDEGPWPADGPTFRLRRDQVQELVDRLWNLGYRPSEGAGSVGALAQAEDHIKSLKRVNDALLEVVAAK